MNIFKWITGRTGKMALSAMQAVGLSAVVGVAGIAAWQYLDAPAETNNTFMPASYDSGEVVYVAGANAGSYSGGSMQISTNTFKRLEQQELSQRAAQEMAEYAPDYSASVAAPTRAYQMGGTEGLGTGANAANEFDLQNNPMAAMQQSMAGISNMVSQAQAQAQTAAAGKPAGGATLASAPKSWGSSGAAGGSSGNSFNSSFSVQDSGKNTRGTPAGADGARQAGNVLASAQAQAAGMMAQEGTRIRGRASFGHSSGLGDSKEATVLAGRRVNQLKNELEDITHKSAAAAKNRNRSTVEGARAFLASTKTSGGMMITADNVTTGQGQGSKDFEQDNTANLRGIRTWGIGQVDTATERSKDRNNMKKWLWVTVAAALAAMIAIPFVKNIPLFGWMIALGLTLAVLALVVTTIVKASQFMHKWHTTDGWGVASIVVAGLMAVGVAAAWIWSTAFKDFFTKVADTLGIGGGSSTGSGAGGAGGGATENLCLNTVGQPASTVPGGGMTA